MKKIIFSLVGFALVFGLVGVASAAESWNLQGIYTIDFVCTSGCSGTYTHTMNVSLYNNNDGTFTGTGWRNAVSSQTWIVEGDVTGDAIEFLINYDGSTYYVDAHGTIATDGTMSGSAVSSSQAFNWAISPKATFYRYAEITSPTEGQVVSGSVSFDAVLYDDDYDAVQWAVRRGTCTAGTNTVWGNVDGHNDSFTWAYNDVTRRHDFSSTADTSSWVPGNYCFVFNPSEDSGEANIRLTRDFVLADAIAPIITFVEPVDGSTHSGIIYLKATCDETCNYINFWWRAEGETFSSASKRYHYVYKDETVFEWDLDTLNALKADGNTYVMEDGTYYLYAAGKDLAGNWARTPEITIIVDNVHTKAEKLIESGVSGKGLENAPGLQKPFNPKSQAGKHAGKK